MFKDPTAKHSPVAASRSGGLRKGSTSQAPAGNAKVAQMVQDQGSIHTVTKAMLEEVEAFSNVSPERRQRDAKGSSYFQTHPISRARRARSTSYKSASSLVPR